MVMGWEAMLGSGNSDEDECEMLFIFFGFIQMYV